ncbi:conjugative transfer system coupling protein TraD [Kistimonas scapharcae]|uniref:Conjugative transfer system coupling protein TraD n=1 Tax=Kistimonas scapharcae TaxID=1036133 RepID=A0ABP8V017_9GAMM
MKKDDGYTFNYRTNYEARAAVSWLIMIVSARFMMFLGLPNLPFQVAMCVGGVFFTWRTHQALRIKQHKDALKGKKLSFLTISQKSQRRLSKPFESLWMGWGFEWSHRHTQASYEIIKRDSRDILPCYAANQKGAPWIHGLDIDEKKLRYPLHFADGHTLITGATGSGKTRLFDLLVTQCVLRNEATIIIDPKGDKDLRNLAERACQLNGTPDRFACFHPGFPEDSIRINLLRNFNRSTEIASRIAGLIITESGTDPFKNFGQMATNNIVQGQLICNERPMLTGIRRYLESGPAPLVIKSLTAYCDSLNINWRVAATQYTQKAKSGDVESEAYQLLRFYREKIQPQHPSSDLEGVLSMFEHDRAHFGKMIATLLPIMGMLTTGEMGELLSPNAENFDDPRRLEDTRSLIEKKACAYIGLDSLTDQMVGSAIGTLFLADLASVAGDRYNYGDQNQPVNIFVDECSEVICDQLIQLLNKGRGSRIRLFVATQTIQDFVARMGNEAKAYQVLGNTNNMISLRVTEDKTQEYVANKLPETRVKYVMRTQGTTTSQDTPDSFTGNHGERLMEEKIQMFIPQLLGQLPDLEYIAMLADGKLYKGRLPILKTEESSDA